MLKSRVEELRRFPFQLRSQAIGDPATGHVPSSGHDVQSPLDGILKRKSAEDQSSQPDRLDSGSLPTSKQPSSQASG